MDGRKVLILLGDKAGALSCIRFVAQVFRHKHTVVVIGFTNQAVLEEYASEIKNTVYTAYGDRENLKFIYRYQQALNKVSIVQESQYCDLIVEPSQPTRAKIVTHNHSTPTGINIPIVTVPAHFKKISEILIVYNGEFQQLQLIKLFFQVLGNLCHEAMVTLVAINHSAHRFRQNEEKLFVEYLKAHCPNLGIIRTVNETPEEIMAMANFENGIVVSGRFSGFDHQQTNHSALFGEINLSRSPAPAAVSLQSP